MEDNPKSSVEEQGMDKGKALVASNDTETVETEEMQKNDYVKVKTLDIGNRMYRRAALKTGRVREASQSTTATLDGIMEALKCGDYNTIGVLGAPESSEIANVLEKVSRRAKRDVLFDVIVMANVSHKPDIRKMQDGIAEALGLKFDDEKKDVAVRAKRLRERILMEHKILVILCDICKGIDLDKVGIPSWADHIGCKLLLTSASEDVLSNQMRAQKIFKV